MRIWRLSLLVATVIFGASAALAAETQVERGKYLVIISGCGTCHTPGALLGKPNSKRVLAGSEVGFGIPGVGVFVGGNLTPDKETGLGELDDRTDYRRHHQRRDAERPQAVPGYALAGPRPSVVGRRPGDRRLSEEPAAGEERGSGTFRAEGRSIDAGLRDRAG